mmetsp:Transcript_28914/g.51691  ORF Transcript_28914/g.51691 Transcript_28914/m.51691 type:complete len:263 (+) Transcript_28914:360-1148(+)
MARQALTWVSSRQMVNPLFQEVARPTQIPTAHSVVKRENGTQGLPLVHQLKGIIDLVKGHAMGDVVVQLGPAPHVLLDQLRHLDAALVAAKRGALPHTASHQLEGTGRYLFPRGSHTNDHRLAPATVGALQRGAHDLHVPRAIKAKVHAPLRHLHDHALDGLVVVLGVQALRGAPLGGGLKPGGVDVHGDDAAGLGLHRRLNHSQPHCANAKHRNSGALVHLRGVVHGAPAGGDATAQQRHLVQRGSAVNQRHTLLVHHGVL